MSNRHTSSNGRAKSKSNMIDVEWESEEERRRRRGYHKASTIHGWVTKMRGTLTGNERVRRNGIREMKAARHVREHLRKKEARRREKEGSSGRGFFSFLAPRRERSVVVVHYGHRRSSSQKRRGDEPLLHFPKRTAPPHHGHGTRIMGHLTSDADKVAAGKAMNESATKQRERERRRRQRQRERDAQKIRAQQAASRAPNWRA